MRKRLSVAIDTGRAEDRKVAGMPLAVIRHPDGRLTWSGSDVVYGDVTRANPNHTLYPEVLVTRIVRDGDGRVTGVKVRDQQTGRKHTIRAQFVVVAADALRTPQLLWASGIRPAALGRYLNDQPQTVFAVRLRDVDNEPETTAVGTRNRPAERRQLGALHR